MLYGTTRHSLDSKGRVTIPAKFRQELGDMFYICKSTDNRCLSVFSPEDWQKALEAIKNLPEDKAPKVRRFLFGGAAEVEPDKQGRIIIPQSLKDFAGIDKEVCVVGIGTGAEIWDSARWDEYDLKQNSDGISMDVVGLIL